MSKKIITILVVITFLIVKAPAQQPVVGLNGQVIGVQGQGNTLVGLNGQIIGVKGQGNTYVGLDGQIIGDRPIKTNDLRESSKNGRSAEGSRISAQMMGLHLNPNGFENRKLLNQIQVSAANGDAIAQYNLGCHYLDGIGIAKNEVEAVKWFRKSANQGFTDAQYNLAFCYLHGRGVVKNEAEAVKWYKKVAENKNEQEVQAYLGFCYAHGRGVVKNEDEAKKWYKKAAESGDELAQLIVALNYSQNDTEAFKWFRKSAEQGNVDAQTELGKIYAAGRGVDKNYTEAVKWLRKASEQGSAEAQLLFGLCYWAGSGVQQDEIEACAYLILASNELELARKQLIEIEKDLSSNQIAAGQRRANELRVKFSANIR